MYEANGFEIVPTTPLGDFFANRVAGANLGAPYNVPITLDKGGKFYSKPGFYPQDWNNFAPSIALAYQPNFHNWLGKVIGREGKSVIRGGFRVSYDHIGEQLAVNFDASNQLGFASALSIPVNTYNITNRLAPLFTGGTPDVRTFPGITFSNSLTFPLTQPSDQAQRIETSLDSAITTPYNYNVALSYEREIGKGFKFQAAYVGRFARNLLAQRDVASFNNIRDPKSGMTYFDAMGQLIKLRYSGTAVTAVQPIPFFENLLPGLARTVTVLGVPSALTATQFAYQRIAYAGVGGVGGTSGFGDYTTRQAQWDDSPISLIQNIFVHPQYAALTTWTTLAKSNYNSAQFSLSQRLRRDITFDFNYTYGHSLDNASGLQNAGNYSTAALIFNPFDLNGQYANSDFDVRHIVNANWLVGLPFGKGKQFLGGANKWVNGIIGGWQMTGVFRWNSGLPVATPFASGRWGTNWQISSFMVRSGQLPIHTTEDKNAVGGPNLFENPLLAFTGWRDPLPGEGGDRNVLRLPGYFDIDAGLYKTFHLTERQSLTLRWETYNVTNTQRLTSPSGFGIGPVDPFKNGQYGLGAITAANLPATFGVLSSTQKPLGESKAGRIMQFAIRWQF